jgi:tetratricopeptide (TPR) repeat protein
VRIERALCPALVARLVRQALACCCLTLCLRAGHTYGLGVEYWHNRLFGARAALTVEKVEGATEAWAEIGTRTEPGTSAPALAVVDAAGTPVPFRVVAMGPGDRVVVAFRMTQLLNYYVYLNPVTGAPGETAPAQQWEPHSGVLLRTFKWGLERADLDTLDGFRALVRASKHMYGGGYRDAIFQGPNPYGPSDRYVSIFTAYLPITEPGRYQFATNSDDASLLYVDDTLVAQYLGRHGAAATYGQRNGAIELAAGVHRLDYYHAEDTGWQACVAGWKKPGDRFFSLIPKGAFVPIVYARVRQYDTPDGVVPDFACRVSEVYASEDGTMALVGVRFDAVPSGVLDPGAYRWTFGDGESAEGKTVEHVYLAQGIVPVTLEILDKQGPQQTVRHWVGVWHLEESNTGNPERTRAGFEQVLAAYSLGAQPTAALETLCAFYKGDRTMDSRRMPICQELVKRLKGTDLPKALAYSFELAGLYEALAPGRTVQVRRDIYASIIERAADEALKARAHLMLGEVLLFYDQNATEAIEHFRCVRDLACPDDVRRLAAIRIGDAHLELGQVQQAREAYLAVPVSDADRRNAAILSEGYGLSVERSLAEGKCDDALETINTWEWRLPEVKLAGYSSLLRVRVALKQGRTREVERYCRLIIDVLVEDAYKPEAYAALIRVLLQAGDTAKAAKRYEELRTNFPLSREARELARHFES